MRVFEMIRDGNLPVVAGSVSLVWESGGFYAIRENWKITLCSNPVAEFFSLDGGRQFAYISEETFYFGGDDGGSPFLVELSDFDPAMQAIIGGEESFFEYLKPSVISELEKRFGTSSKRQGDWYAVSLPFDIDGLKVWEKRLFGLEAKAKHVDKYALDSTRHFLTGDLVTEVTIGMANGFIRRGIFAIGVLESPHHPSMDIPNLHFLARCDKLVGITD